MFLHTLLVRLGESSHEHGCVHPRGVASDDLPGAGGSVFHCSGCWAGGCLHYALLSCPLRQATAASVEWLRERGLFPAKQEYSDNDFIPEW